MGQGAGFPGSANSIPSDQAAMARLKDTGTGKESIIKRRGQHTHIKSDSSRRQDSSAGGRAPGRCFSMFFHRPVRSRSLSVKTVSGNSDGWTNVSGQRSSQDFSNQNCFPLLVVYMIQGFW